MELEYKRLGMDSNFNKIIIDTMRIGTNICELPKAKGIGYKRPKLKELHRFLFKKEMENAHDAMGDINATLACFLNMYENYKDEFRNKNF